MPRIRRQHRSGGVCGPDVFRNLRTAAPAGRRRRGAATPELFQRRGQPQSVHNLLKKSFALVLILSAALCTAAVVFRDTIPMIFGSSGETAVLVSSALLIAAFSFPMMGITRLASSFFYAVQKTRYSIFVIYADPLALTPPVPVCASPVLGRNGYMAFHPCRTGHSRMCSRRPVY